MLALVTVADPSSYNVMYIGSVYEMCYYSNSVGQVRYVTDSTYSYTDLICYSNTLRLESVWLAKYPVNEHGIQMINATVTIFRVLKSAYRFMVSKTTHVHQQLMIKITEL